MLRMKRNVALAPYTTFKIGGPAEYYTEVTGALDLAEAIEFSDKENIPHFVFGGGSNVLFSDKGFKGLVIRLIDGGCVVRGEVVHAGAGIPLAEVVQTAADAGLSGLENLAGIPGSLGGAIRGNAGAFGTEIGSLVKTVKVFHGCSGMVQELSPKECQFAYRDSYFKRKARMTILSAELKLIPGDAAAIKRAMKDTVRKREAKHDQAALCAGSFFMNPVVTDKRLRSEFEKDTGKACKDDKLPAGWLIDHAGLRGKQVGGARVSDQHPNYIVNTGEATAEDVVMLASLIKTTIRDNLKVILKEEVQLVGF